MGHVPAVVDRHWDTVHLAGVVELADPTLLAFLREPVGTAVRAVWEADDGAIRFDAQRSRGATELWMRNADPQVHVNPFDRNGKNVRVEVSAAYLMSHPIAIAIALVRRVANAMGKVTRREIARVDPAVDMARAPLRPSDIEALVVQRRARKGRLARVQPTDEFGHPDDDAVPESDVRQFYQGNDGELTGLVVGQGGDLSLRAYDKRRELQLASRAHKREATEALWLAGGWNGADPVHRFEWQLRGAVLDELGVRDPDTLLREQDAVYQYCVRWLRVVVPGTATLLKRCKLDPRWDVLMGVVFVHQSSPAARSRRRGGMRPLAVLKNAMSCLAGVGVLSEFMHDVPHAVPPHVAREVRRVLVRPAREIDREPDEGCLGEDEVWRQLRSDADRKRARFASADDAVWSDVTKQAREELVAAADVLV